MITNCLSRLHFANAPLCCLLNMLAVKNKMVRIFILIGVAFIFIPNQIEAGAANATLECRSENSNGDVITLKGEIPGDFAEFSLVFTIGDKSVQMTDRKSSDTINVVYAWKHKVFTIAVNSVKGFRNLMMYAIPNTVQVNEMKKGSEVNFTAIVEQAPIPGYKGTLWYQSFLHDIRMNCKWKYSN